MHVLVPTKLIPPALLLNTQIILPQHNLFFALISPMHILLSLSNNIIHSGAHFLDSLLGVFGAKDGSTGDKDVGACTLKSQSWRFPKRIYQVCRLPFHLSILKRPSSFGLQQHKNKIKRNLATYRLGRIDKHCQIQHHHQPGCSSQGTFPSIP